jgi:RHS repeat-associated protein
VPIETKYILKTALGYYGHGPLARVELGEHKVETSNYAYTLQGWIKGVKGENFSYALGYNTSDYNSIGASNGLLTTPVAKPLFNGNIATMATDIPKFGELGESRRFDQQFSYDQLNRIKSSQQLTGDGYKTSYMYDPNGNIQGLTRNDKLGAPLDALAYHYENKTDLYKYNTNKLRSVSENAPVTASGEDLENQSIDNYDYDDIGNLLKDNQEDIAEIKWTVYGKVKSVTRKAGSNKPSLEFSYDASGNRVSKKVINTNGIVKTTFYVRDASGNTMAIYEKESAGALALLTEQYVYGSSRIGIIKPTVASLQAGRHFAGLRSYELSDHLGNVSVTLSDYRASVQSANNYYPFGMASRSFNAGDYRYAYNGKELDVDFHSNYDYGMRIYDNRTAKFLSVDPLTMSYPGLTPYQFASNSPIANIDIDGLESLYYKITHDDKTGVATIKLADVKTSHLDKLLPYHVVVSIDGGEYMYAGDYVLSFESQRKALASDLKDYAKNPQAAVAKFTAAKADAEKHAAENKQFWHNDLWVNATTAAWAAGVKKGTYSVPTYKNVNSALGEKKYLPIASQSVAVKNKEALKILNNLEKNGNWAKVYEAGYIGDKKVEVHYFVNKSTGTVVDAKIKIDGDWNPKNFGKQSKGNAVTENKK